jgi:acyl-CoA synthetase (NDP forming)
MKPELLIKNAMESGRFTLNEVESKQLLTHFGIPTLNEMVAENELDAVRWAESIGYPVVMKGLKHDILHKSDLGLVRLNIHDSHAVKKVFHELNGINGNALEGILIQPQIAGKRELVAGLFRDQQFGPIVMFGLGGVYTEIFSDVALRMAPLTPSDAESMIDQIRTKRILGDFRGETPVDRQAIINVLLGLSQISQTHDEVKEIDINPLIVSPEGDLTAVDALAILKKPSPEKAYPDPIPPESIGPLFYPNSVVFIGASAQLGKWGHTLLVNTVSGGFKGDVYLVNPKGGTIAGREVFASLSDIPDGVDLAVVTIPAAKVSDLIPQLAAKGIKNMLLISSGFGETGPEGKELERQLVRRARDAGILILGPNTMGICNPHVHFYCTGSPVKPMAGSTAVVAQSGNMGVQLLAFAERQGIGIRGFCGSGNEAMMTIEDYIDAFETDSVTRTVILYIESIKNGRRFFRNAFRVGKKKPIILLKGGRSQAGHRAAASHTGAMASDIKVFEDVCRQAGIVKVEQPMDLLDLAASFSSLPLPKGNRAAIMTLGGGWGVVTADLCSEFGLEVPSLSNEIITRIDRILPPYWSHSNPVDIVGENDPSLPVTILEELLQWTGCDAVINLGIVGRKTFIEQFGNMVLKADPNYSADDIEMINQQLAQIEKDYIEHVVRLMEKYNKPVIGVSLLTDADDKTVYRVANSPFKGLFFPSPERAVKSLAKMYEYQCFLNRSA